MNCIGLYLIFLHFHLSSALLQDKDVYIGSILCSKDPFGKLHKDSCLFKVLYFRALNSALLVDFLVEAILLMTLPGKHPQIPFQCFLKYPLPLFLWSAKPSDMLAMDH